ncbi:MAG: MFS transporter [Sulfurimonas sp. RIFOXYD12_FULL_33_39]|uniref:MFS transporter n=1 Tax=unclassified Sulfurimonas TaxID=2623549 RepID=UPI0008B00EB5|nr:MULTISPECIES: MFS transporter [unclassified Sulfurimonas]OHE05374.1 MAG: MFS transporter [Sulfurimonas sp. RIFCSPLOWO2_12_FULL_34_6]OHE09848.1 MAG: MFS transporter [Sulfurimonas sp. RIFOXYD12_FULL_33_39]OHE13644.1 MAG: MFS transporter [Sulfurimonas sp. RIFOXYD2_FULL_34_21]DAB27372.1 MAG TPA: MFS transporter [Sulfurimonas sp. UBA10385]
MFKKVFPLSAILSLRFLGLFLVLPVISIYALELENSTPMLVGIVVGGYALTQAIFQVPFGAMSDKIGRKPTLLVGLLIFLAGSIICAYSTDIYTLMIGRFLQGAGAIGSVITAMISDLVEEEIRGKAMAIMGASIAISFALAMGLGPVLGAKYGISFLFILTAIFALFAIILLFTKVPTPPKIKHTYHESAKTSDILKDSNLLNMIIINAMQKGLMTIAFVLIPIILTSADFTWQKSDLYMAYLPAMIFGLVAMGPAAVFGEKYNKPKEIFLLSIALFIGSFLIMGLTSSSTIFIIGVVLFFIAFNMMEPLVQSMITKFAKVHQKGAALGIANSAAYFSTFIGGTTAGLLLGFSNRETIGISVAIVAVFWLLWTLRLQNPIKHSHLYISQNDVDMSKLKNIESNHIAEWYINDTEKLVIIKYVSDAIEKEDLKAKISR